LPNTRNSGNNIIELSRGSGRNTAKLTSVPVSPVNRPRRRGNTDKMGVVGVGAAGVAAGAAMASGAVANGGNAPLIRRGAGGGAGAGGAGAPPPPPRRRRGWLIALLLLLLLSLLFCSVIAYAAPNTFKPLQSVVPPALTGSPTGTVTITPKHADLKNAYIITAVPGTPDSSGRQVQARFLNSNVPPQSKTVNATGIKQTPGAAAHGTLTFRNGTGSAFGIKAGEQFGVSVIVATDSFVSIPPLNISTGVAGTASVSAHTVNVGTKGNIGAGAISGSCCTSNNDIFVVNAAFTGGQDPQNYTFVQQSDIDGAANPLKGPLTQSALSSVQGQKHTGEQFVNSPRCMTDVTSNHNAGDKASSVTVTVNAKCTVEAYDLKGAQTLAANALTKQAAQNPGAGYALVGGIATNSSLTNVDSKGNITLNVKTEGVWVYQFSDAQKTQLAKLIAGKSKSDATTILLQQAGVDAVDSIDSNTLPTDYTKINIVIQNVPGVQGTGTPPVSSGTGTPIIPTVTEPKGIVTPTQTPPAVIGGS
ncbi:MAG: hypothetical protein M3Z24_02845, partial [Chloroflexota bacterium]|nr:hypothetical protein [Chloroflexota bacterium]